MVTSSLSSLTIGWVAIATGVVGLLGLVFILLFFTVAPPFGRLNDICIGVAAILSAVLAGMLYSEQHAQSALLSQAALMVALVGALVVVVGSVLVIFGVTDWFLAGLYMAAGNALIGLWLFAVNYSAQLGNFWPHGLSLFGMVSGVIMAVGLVAIPGIFKGIDSSDRAPWTIRYIGQVGGLGWLILYPIWCVLLGRVLLKA